MAEYYTRPLHPSDFSAVADLLADAYIDIPEVADCWPRARQHWALWRHMWLRILRSDYLRPGMQLLVTMHVDRSASAQDPPAQTPAAIACWRRDGPSDDSDPAARAWKQRNAGFFTAIERFLGTLQQHWIDLTRIEAAGCDLVEFNILERLAVDCSTRWRKVYPRRWHLQMLGVARAHRRRGLAGKLVGWGVQRSEDEGLPATLFATDMGQPLYERGFGFRVVAREQSPDGKFVFHPFMVREPRVLAPGIVRLADVEEYQEWVAKTSGSSSRSDAP